MDHSTGRPCSLKSAASESHEFEKATAQRLQAQDWVELAAPCGYQNVGSAGKAGIKDTRLKVWSRKSAMRSLAACADSRFNDLHQPRD